MEVSQNTNRIHPLVAVAAVSVTLVSLTGIAAITGLLPNSHSSNAPAANVAASQPAASAVAAVPETKTAASVAPDERPAPVQAAKKPAPMKQNTARSASSSQAKASAQYHAPVAQAPRCYDCGRIESVYAVQQQAQPSGVGVVAGAVLGGVLGNQVGKGNGRTLATVAGAVGGGYAGNEIEKRTRAAMTYQVRVRMEDGSVRTVPLATQEGWQVGDRVKIVDGRLVARA